MCVQESDCFLELIENCYSTTVLSTVVAMFYCCFRLAEEFAIPGILLAFPIALEMRLRWFVAPTLHAGRVGLI